ncbi:hypothetical protein NEMBOFW57_004464 [Staphylotrichum longicolle]|uniref:Alpha/beta hydrolase fold-3 domain-containing protein n=1 Tax=Staphylotrichum longicolle TaxID=669026 RepID=A0AAD4I6P9_9PEZI|nr:hypothetical protein NEMBOFW57_004464 [Staphylotrichum longicolle]
MIDHLLGRPSVKSRRLQVLAVLTFWSAYLVRGNNHGPPVLRVLSRVLTKRLTAWQLVLLTMIYLYIARNFSTLVGLASPDPLTNMYDATYFRATWVLTALDAGFWTAMRIGNKTLRDVASIAFSLFYLVAAEQADEKVRKVRGNITVEHMRVSWNKGSQSPILRFVQSLMRPRFTKWPAREIRIHRPHDSDYREPVSAWLYFDGPKSDLEHHNKIILDIPGGGFVAMNPRCNDDKLFSWAAKTGLPILSLDYKKAPEHPFPYALNECYDVYTAIIKSRGRCIGLSGKEVPKIVISGDSAGGTLATATTLMIIESGSSPKRRFSGKTLIPIPAGLMLFYPALDMNIGSWMSDEQMALIKDRRMRGANRGIIKRKKSAYDSLVGTPSHSDDEEDSAEVPKASGPSGANTARTTPPKDTPPTEEASPTAARSPANGASPAKGTSPPKDTAPPNDTSTPLISPEHARSPAPEYAHSGPTTWSQVQPGPPALPSPGATVSPSANSLASTGPGSSHHPQPMRTRLATSSIISYFNDRVLTPELMRAMIILYVGPHARPDFSQDYLLSPILAPDILLAKFPKTYFLTGERDPLVDDTVIFAGRIRRVKAAMMASGGTRLEYKDQDAQTPGFNEKAVAEMVLIPGISHGFLQFPSVYPPAWKLIDRAAGWAEEVLMEAEAGEERNGSRSGKGTATGSGGGSARHHFRRGTTESSGSEDRPLEMMSITRARAKSLREAQGGADGVEGGKVKEGSENGQANGDGNGGVGGVRNKKKTKKKAVRRGSMVDDQELGSMKLPSTDDLLGRRMEGLAGGLTSLPPDPQ